MRECAENVQSRAKVRRGLRDRRNVLIARHPAGGLFQHDAGFAQCGSRVRAFNAMFGVLYAPPFGSQRFETFAVQNLLLLLVRRTRKYLPFHRGIPQQIARLGVQTARAFIHPLYHQFKDEHHCIILIPNKHPARFQVTILQQHFDESRDKMTVSIGHAIQPPVKAPCYRHIRGTSALRKVPDIRFKKRLLSQLHPRADRSNSSFTFMIGCPLTSSIADVFPVDR